MPWSRHLALRGALERPRELLAASPADQLHGRESHGRVPRGWREELAFTRGPRAASVASKLETSQPPR